MQAIVFDIKRYAVHDGPGIRTSVFFKGCPLRCVWCHNPESYKAGIEPICRSNRLGDIEVADESQIGKVYSLDQLIFEIENDQLFFDESGGGVTFSGGEPLMQIDFLEGILKACKEREIHTALDTTAYAKRDKLDRIIDYVDLFLFDLKHMVDEDHRKHTGVSNQLILDNLVYLSEKGKRIIIRFPMIPGYNDSKSNINLMLDFLNQLPSKPEFHILPYHRTGQDKFRRFGIETTMPDIPSLLEEDTVWVQNVFKAEGYTVKVGG
ncbi:glycyl-radical enzyme activating protein [Ancylomarina salipaludis]|nr:glycyl-radical enzyme activating protein [Ancylomarina salipaludis]